LKLRAFTGRVYTAVRTAKDIKRGRDRSPKEKSSRKEQTGRSEREMEGGFNRGSSGTVLLGECASINTSGGKEEKKLKSSTLKATSLRYL